MTTVSLKLPEPLHRKLAGTARRMGRSKSALIREALELYLDGRARPARGSLYDLMRHVVGKFEGRPDLSSNKRLLRGFGK
jgi:metal-responsive CopG/Arc/MetJ family transcriptional regulator